MVVMRIDPEKKRLLDIFWPYVILQFKFDEPYILSDDAPKEAIEAHEKYQKIVEKEKEIDKQWLL